MPSLRERITQALLARLAANLPSLNVQRAPVPAAQRQTLPQLIVEPQGESVEPGEGESVLRQLTLAVAVLTRGDDAVASADAWQVSVHPLLMAIPQPSEPGFLIRELGCDWELEDADLIAVRLITRYQISYHSHPQDISKED